MTEVPISWQKVKGGTTADWIGYRLDVFNFMRGISPKKQTWVINWLEEKMGQGGIVGRELRSVLGRLSFIAGALRHVKPFLSPLFAWASAISPGTYAKMPDAVMILFQFIRDEVRRNPMRRAKKMEDRPVEGFRIDAEAQKDEIVIGGWETYETEVPAKTRWFSIRLSRRLTPWAYLRGDPFRSIASLELLGVLLAVMIFGPNAKWRGGRRSMRLTGVTDNAGNSHVLRKFGSSKYPLSIVVMELACQLDLLDVELELGWVPRAQNYQADDLTNERFDEFDEANRMHVDFENLPFLVMGRLMQKAGELDSELKLHKTSKEAKAGSGEGGQKKEATGKSKRRKSDMRWQDPW